MVTTSDARAIYHGIRRAGRGADTFTALRGVKVPRGQGATRDKIARALAELRQAPAERQAPLDARLNNYLARLAYRAVIDRGISMPAGLTVGALWVVQRRDGMALLLADYWYEYSRREGAHYIRVAYLMGVEDGQRWIIRPPGTVSSIGEALDWTMPAAARHARKAGRPVKRQGDIVFVGRLAGSVDLSELNGTRHEARKRQGGGYTIVHPEHKPLRLDSKHHWRAYMLRQDVNANGRYGD